MLIQKQEKSSGIIDGVRLSSTNRPAVAADLLAIAGRYEISVD